MVRRLVGGDRSGIDQGLHIRVIVGHLEELTVTQHICARITDVHEGESAAKPIQPSHGGAHAGEFRLTLDHCGDAVADLVDRISQCGQYVLGIGWTDVDLGDRCHGHRRGQFAGRMPAHAICHE